MNNNKHKNCHHKYDKGLCIHCEKPEPKSKKEMMAALREKRAAAGIVNFTIDCTEVQKQLLKDFTSSWELPKL